MNQTNTVTSADIAPRVLTFCILMIGGILVLSTYAETHTEVHTEVHTVTHNETLNETHTETLNETRVTQCAQIVVQEPEQ